MEKITILLAHALSFGKDRKSHLREVFIRALISLIVLFSLHAHAYTNFKTDIQWSDITVELSEFSKYRSLKGLQGDELKSSLGKIASKNYRSMGYDQARFVMFTEIDNHNGEVCSVYSLRECLITHEIPNNREMNAEHTWPKSLGAATVPAKSDLHHLYPTTNHANSVRSSLPFCEVVTVDWENDGSKRGQNANGEHCFEPPAYHRGNVARSLFYFAVRYGHTISDSEEYFLRKWHHDDPVTEQDRLRNEKIKSYQRNSNPFIDIPELVDLVNNF